MFLHDTTLQYRKQGLPGFYDGSKWQLHSLSNIINILAVVLDIVGYSCLPIYDFIYSAKVCTNCKVNEGSEIIVFYSSPWLVYLKLPCDS